MPKSGWRVVAFEARRQTELTTLLRQHHADAFVAPILDEVPIGANPAIDELLRRLAARDLDGVIALTGVAVRHLVKVTGAEPLAEGLRPLTVVARGPKPTQALREIGIEPAIRVPEPNTWRETLRELEPRTERRWAVIEYGRPDQRLIDGLMARGGEVLRVPVYEYALPADTGPAEEVIDRLIRGEAEAIVFTSSAQYHLLEELATRKGVLGPVRDALGRIFVASIGPTMTETLETAGHRVDLEATPPKMGILVHQLAAAAMQKSK